MRIAVIGDVHANARALTAALAVADSGGYDQLVLLGDLLTYGADVRETLELVIDRITDGRTILLRGNHDALYGEMLEGASEYGDRLPAWIMESVMWSLARLPADLWSALPFRDAYERTGFLFCHANPFGPANWEYLNGETEYVRAAETLRERRFRLGVFGHTHRTKWYRHFSGPGSGFDLRACGDLEQNAVHVLNAGAIGQPRDASNPAPHVLWLNVVDDSGAAASFKLQRFNYDVTNHLQRVNASGLSAVTLAHIVAFFDFNS